MLSKETPASKSLKPILSLAADVYLKYKGHYRKIENSRKSEPEKLRETSTTLLKKKLPEQTQTMIEMIEQFIYESASTVSISNQSQQIMQVPKYKNLVQKIIKKLMFRKQIRDDLKKLKTQNKVNDILKSLK